MDALRPDYHGAWIGGIVPALLAHHVPSWVPEPVHEAAGVVLLVLDGLGWHALGDHPERLPTLAAMAGGPITSVVPSTTGAALTSITTGLTPAEHGLVGYRIRVGGTLLNVLTWTASANGPKPPAPESVQQAPPFLGQRVPVVTRGEFARSGFTRAHLRSGELTGWRATSTLVEQCRRHAADGRGFVYAYYDGVDRVAHEFGLRSAFFPAELAATDRLVADLLAALPSDWALLVTADHGQIHVEPSGLVALDAVAPLVAAYSGEGRFRSLHAGPGTAGRLFEAVRERYAEQAWIFTRDELFDDGWLGEGAAVTVRGRVGDVVLAARDGWSFLDPGDPQEATLVARHGSLTPAEVRVPLLAARGTGPGQRTTRSSPQ